MRLIFALFLLATAAHAGIVRQDVRHFSKSGSTGLIGDVTISEGSNITLTQLGQNITISATGSGGSSGIVENYQTGMGYTLVLTDQDKLVSLSNASPVSVTVPANSSVAFPIGSVVQLINNGVASVGVGSPVGVTINSVSDFKNLRDSYAQATLVKTLTDTWYLYGANLTGFMSATGGTVTTDGNYKVHTFTTSGTFTVTSGSGSVDSLVIAGGGAGGASYGGGGGAGGYKYASPGAVYSAGAYTVTIGAGATCGTPNGGNSVFDTITSTGGGIGASNGAIGGNGGSGGGGDGANAGGTASPAGQGFNGGDGFAGGQLPAGGGGGACGLGQNATITTIGNGGVGCSNSISGSAVFYASGGGGGAGIGFAAGTASAGGGGNGANQGLTGATATANTGGGGGGGGGSGACGPGGSGVVILRYRFQ